MHAKRLVIISGISGSGKSTALNAFEDLGYFCVDNLPAPLINQFVDFVLNLPPDWSGCGRLIPETLEDKPSGASIALLVDCRDNQSVREVLNGVSRLRSAGVDVQLLYFDCRDDIVVRRYQETRRPHPLLMKGSPSSSIREALQHERELTAAFRAVANQIFDSSTFSPHELRDAMRNLTGEEVSLALTVTSFGFKYGPPKDADLIVDVRFLPNPHFVAELREQTGLEPAVRDYVINNNESSKFLGLYLELVKFLLPRYQKEGKRYLNIGVGCTGGKHRSVVIAEELAAGLKDLGFGISVKHRDRTTP